MRHKLKFKIKNLKLRNSLIFIFAFFILHFSLSSCGYSLVGRGTSLPPYLNSISIPIFLNKSGEPNIEFEITNRIRDGFIEDGRLKMIENGGSDLILNGEIIKYSLKPVSFDPTDNVTEYWVEIGVLIRLEDRTKGNIILQQNHYTKWDYKVSQNVAETDVRRLEAIRQAGRKLAQEIVSIVMEGF